MKLSYSNIGWEHNNDEKILNLLSKIGFDAIEIAPTIVVENPYSNTQKAVDYARDIHEKYGLAISSMQSIWYGKTGNIFDSRDREELITYTKKAIDFAKEIKCHNLVFGCPKNRILLDGHSSDEAVVFFKELGDYAKTQGTVLALEANPSIYGTNFINKSIDAFDYVRKVKSDGFKVNLDFGTIIQNHEKIEDFIPYLDLVNHVHISEPNLVPIKKRNNHKKLASILRDKNYQGFVSVEMKNIGDDDIIKSTADYIKEIYG